jgi:muramoyltetrapeptide carboxypeptidase
MRSLESGDIVDLIAPASGFNEDEYNSCLKFVESLGLKPRVRPFAELINSESQFVSNTAEYRFSALDDALKNSESRAVWSMAGGYGSYHLLAMLDKIPAPHKQKLFIGFSDNSVLLDYFVGKWNWPCIYGVTLLQIARGQVSQAAIESLKSMIFKGGNPQEVQIAALNNAANKNDQFTGKMLGGCLSLVQTLIGTPQKMDVQGKIILLEDDKYETPARVDRIFNHMIRANFFDGSRAVILGSFFEEDFEKHKAGFEIGLAALKTELDKKNIPLFRAENIGHSRDMISVAFGSFVNIKSSENAVLTFGN